MAKGAVGPYPPHGLLALGWGRSDSPFDYAQDRRSVIRQFQRTPTIRFVLSSDFSQGLLGDDAGTSRVFSQNVTGQELIQFRR